MPIVVNIMLRKSMEHAFADPHSIYLIANDQVIVETEHGLEVGTVTEKEKMLEKVDGKIYRVIRKCAAREIERMQQNHAKEREAYTTCVQHIEKQKLEMQLTSVEYTFDRRKLFIYYTAEGRVDFRELIKELGQVLHTKIQMVQIGVRDEAKMLGGFGPCGRATCCASFLREFKPVVIDMVKDQGLALNPTKISGLCGRLICCLGYEHKFYKEMCGCMPQQGDIVKTADGEGKVKNINIFKEEVEVLFEDSSAKKYPVKECTCCKEKKHS